MSDIPSGRSIEAYFHCALCLPFKPDNQSPSEYAQIEAGWTPLGNLHSGQLRTDSTFIPAMLRRVSDTFHPRPSITPGADSDYLYMPVVRVLDLFCGAGGAAMGYSNMGFDVVGVDIAPQPNFPFEFHQADALTFPLDGFHMIHASPPCQYYSNAQRIKSNEHPDFVSVIRQRLMKSRIDYVIENVVGAPLINPILLCGEMFSLGVRRHRLFETSFILRQPRCPDKHKPQTKLGRRPKEGEMIHVVGNYIGASKARAAMEIDWMTRNELREAIPPAYTTHVARSFLKTD